MIAFIVQIPSLVCVFYEELVNNSAPPIREFPVAAFVVFHEILFFLYNPNLYSKFLIRESLYNLNLSVFGTRLLPLRFGLERGTALT